VTPDARTTLVGVIGQPVRHSLSPLLHNAAFAALDLNWTSVAFEVPNGQAGAALAAMRALGVAGLSVTMPHKADVAALADERSDEVAVLEAANCVVNRDGILRAENTDGAGFVAALARGAGRDPAGLRCLVVGAGGAARAVTLALAQAGAAAVQVCNRTSSKADAVAALAGPDGSVVEGAGVAAAAGEADLVVQATPVGLAGAGAGDADWIVPPSCLHGGQIVVDLIYAPRPTPWLAAAAAQGATTLDGLGMLVHQAAIQIEHWTGQVAPVAVMWEAVSAVVG
jgi:shikimate dehydrogenase